LVDPLQAAVAMQQGMTGGVNSPDRLLFLGGVMVGVVVLMLSVAALCSLAARETTAGEAPEEATNGSILTDAEVWAMAAASITGFWLLPSGAPQERESTQEEPLNRIAA